MAALKFADSHNMVAFLEKPAECEGFEQIVDFLNAHTIKKKVVITESTIRRDLQLEDAEGTDCVPNAAIFEQLALMGAKTTAWIDFSSIMASAIICLATNQKFNFSKYIFDNMVKNVDSMGKFLMYLKFVQIFLDRQLEGMATHDEIFVTPSHTKKVFANMKMQGKEFSGRVTPLFSTMMVQAQEDIDEAVNEEMGDCLERATTTATGLDTEQDIGVNTPQSDEDRLKLNELMELCTNLQKKVLDLETSKTSQDEENASLKRRVKKLEKKDRKRPHKLKRLYRVGLSTSIESSDDASLGEEDVSKQERINAIDANEDIYLVNVPRDEDMFGVNDLEGDEVVVESDVAAKKKDDEVNVVEKVVSTAGDAAPVSAATITTVELTLSQTLAVLKSARPKAKGLVIPEQEPSKSITTTTTKTTAGILLQEPSETRTTTTPAIPSKDKGKGIMVEDPLKMKKKDQINFDQQEAMRLQSQFYEEARIAREKEEANAALIAQWNDILDKVETDYEFAQRLQAEEQEELTDAEKATLFVQLLEKRRKHFAAKRVEEKRNIPLTKAQQRSIMCTYLKNMAGWKPKDLKNKSFATIQDLFDKAMKRQKLDEKVEAKVDDAKEAEELKQCLELVSDDGDDVTIDATPLFKKTEPLNYMDTFLLLNLKTMFEHHVEDGEWKNQQGLVKVLNWKLFDSYGVHYVTVQSISYYLLVEKMYTLTNHTLHQMFNDVKLQVDYECGMAYKLFRLVKK
ncbi:hypothetical protein Tco_0926674 [Tanacetum coccineum]|uniref:Uncharacterized protein n=1 Tax=Tanacetum coccineum TaxID=301880 RepID=A0ABQ5DAH9_9ASTR